MSQRRDDTSFGCHKNRLLQSRGGIDITCNTERVTQVLGVIQKGAIKVGCYKKVA